MVHKDLTYGLERSANVAHGVTFGPLLPPSIDQKGERLEKGEKREKRDKREKREKVRGEGRTSTIPPLRQVSARHKLAPYEPLT